MRVPWPAARMTILRPKFSPLLVETSESYRKDKRIFQECHNAWRYPVWYLTKLGVLSPSFLQIHNSSMSTAKIVVLAAVLALGSCSADIYLRDGVTDGDTFYLSPTAMTSADPVTQSWVSYSLTVSTCQLTIGATNPARASSFVCELTARRHLLATWSEQQAAAKNAGTARYLNQLQLAAEAGFLQEYVAYFHARPGWILPVDLRLDAFRQWRRIHLKGHKPKTRLKGSWGYAVDHSP